MQRLGSVVITALVAVTCLSMSAGAEEVMPSAAAPNVFWAVLEYILGILLVPLMALLIKLAKDYSAVVAAKKLGTQASVKDKLKLVAEKVLARLATNVANKQIVAMKEAAVDGKVTKEELKKLGDEAVADAKAELGPAVAAAVSDVTLHSILRKQVDKLTGSK